MKYLFIILSAFLILSCKNEAVKEETAKPASKVVENQLELTNEQLKTIELSTVKMAKKQISGTLQLNGKVDIDPDSKVSISSALGGHVKSVRVLPGKFVRKGDVIVIIEDNQFIQIQQDYLTTQAQLLSAAPNYNRQKELNTTKSTSDKLMQQAETEYKSLLAIKNGLEEKLRLLNINPSKVAAGKIQRSINIVAPFSGVVSGVNVNKGKYVAPSDVLVELINPQGLILKVKVFEKDLPQLKVGQIIHFTLTNNPAIEYDARVFSIGSSFENDSKTIAIHCKVTGNKEGLIDGMNITGIVSLSDVTAPAVPNGALVSADGKDYIFVKTNKEPAEHAEEESAAPKTASEEKTHAAEEKHGINFERIEVAKGVSNMGYTAITFVKEIPEDTQIVTKGAFFINAKLVGGGGHDH